MFWKNTGSPGWLVVFLGNPGVKYEKTRHNAGFLAGDILAEKLGAKINRVKWNAYTATATCGGEKLFLLKPQTYMNLSGRAVAPAADFYRVPPERVLVVTDDVALPVGKLRIRRNGSAGGHNGLKSIIGALGTQEFPRIKIGVGMPSHPDFDMADWVTGAFSPDELRALAPALEQAAEAVRDVVSGGVEGAMNRYN